MYDYTDPSPSHHTTPPTLQVLNLPTPSPTLQASVGGAPPSDLLEQSGLTAEQSWEEQQAQLQQQPLPPPASLPPLTYAPRSLAGGLSTLAEEQAMSPSTSAQHSSVGGAQMVLLPSRETLGGGAGGLSRGGSLAGSALEPQRMSPTPEPQPSGGGWVGWAVAVAGCRAGH